MTYLSELLTTACEELFNLTVEPVLTRPDEQFGDYATNVALQLAGKVEKSPRDIAEQLKKYIESNNDGSISNVEVAGPGFLNITLSDEILQKVVQDILEHDSYGHNELLKGQKIVIETNNPNPFKDLHIGHAYNIIVANAVANVLEAGGAEVHRVSYHGDVGLHVGKSMWAILKHIGNDPVKLADVAEVERPSFMSKMYAEGSTAYKDDETAKAEIDALAKQSFTLDDPVCAQVFETCKTWSFEYFDRLFERLRSKPVEKRYLERDTDTLGKQLVMDNVGPVFTESDGAIIYEGERDGLHTRVFINSSGNTLYEARDLGLAVLKDEDFHMDRSLVITGNEQGEYFKVVYAALANFMPELAEKCGSIATGIVKLTTGKMSSRTGDVINIEWVFDAVEQAMKEKGYESHAAEANQFAAIAYLFLKARIGGDIVFDPKESVSLEGNTGPYLQYAHARARSILAKAEMKAAGEVLLQADERSLVRKLSMYPEVVTSAVNDLMPHHICTYLYELSQTFNRFYEKNRVIGDEREALRLQLVNAYATTLKQGLELLNIPAPDKM